MKKKNKTKITKIIDNIITAKSGYIILNDDRVKQIVIDVYNDEYSDFITKKKLNCGSCLINILQKIIEDYEQTK